MAYVMTPIHGDLAIGGYRNRGAGLARRSGSGFTRSAASQRSAELTG
ncbi:hypothetical protein C4K23_2009 [Pseudomonas chlororaphis]|nr:hypothetical protein C4K23_2009 [Pseudomonas chlororaphis]